MAMIVVIRADAGEEQLRAVINQAEALGISYHLSRGAERSILIADGGDAATAERAFAALTAVDQVLPLSRPYRLSSREVHPADTLVQVEGLVIGAGELVVIAGTASVEADATVVESALLLREAGAHVVRTGVYRPTTGLFGTPQVDAQALARLDSVRREAGVPVAAEVLAAEDVPAIARHVDILIVGGAQMQSRSLLQACGWSNRPVILQRGESAQVQELLQASDHLLAGGNRQVVLCEQGIRTYEPATKHTLDLSAVPLVRRVSHLPILVDPCRGSGLRGLVEPLALAALAAGAQGLILDVQHAGAPLSPDGDAAIELGALARLIARLHALRGAL